MQLIQVSPDLTEHRSTGVLNSACIDDIHANMHMQTCTKHKARHKDDTGSFLDTLNLKAILDKEVYDMAGMQESCSLLRFSSRLNPPLLSLNVK